MKRKVTSDITQAFGGHSATQTALRSSIDGLREQFQEIKKTRKTSMATEKL